MDWKLELAKSLFGFRRVESFPELATQALIEEADTPSLRILAGMTPTENDNDELREYLQKSLRELGVEWPSQDEAAWLLFQYYINEIIDERIEPHAGIHTIIFDIYHEMGWSDFDRNYAGDSIKLEKLYGLCDTYDDLAEATSRWDKEKTNEELKALIQKEILSEVRNYKEKFPDLTVSASRVAR